MENLNECNYCLDIFDSDKHAPYVLPCGHSICKIYIDKAYSILQKNIKCPEE